MSLLVTSITMGKQPDRLLDKGPQYLRTRTNRGLFAHHRKSAVELLAASKSQFYKCPSVSLDDASHVTSTTSSAEGLGQSDLGAWQEKKPSRSKSEFDITTLKSLIAIDNDDDDDNDDIFDDNLIQENIQSESVKTTSSPLGDYKPKKTNLVHSADNQPQTKDTANNLHSYQNQSSKIVTSTKEKPHPVSRKENIILSRKPIPVPRRPVPPPRKPSLGQVVPSSSQHVLLDINRKHSLDSNQNYKESSHKDITARNDNKGSRVANLRQRFNSLGANIPLSNRTKEWENDNKNLDQTTPTRTSESSVRDVTYQATPIFISKPDSLENQPDLEGSTLRLALTPDGAESNRLAASSEIDNSIKGRKRYQEVSMSSKSYSKRERRGSNTDSNSSGQPVADNSGNNITIPSPDMSSNISTPGVIVEMSIESVDQVVCCDSEVNAIPAAVTTSADSLTGENTNNNNKIEVSRKKQTISGKMDVSLHEPSLRPSHSPSHFNPSMPRSHSDIGCRLEIDSQHSRDSSLVSNHSRLSRVSAGGNLESFFNQMGLEKGVLEPLNRLRELQNSEVLASVSSLDSHDAASICSSFSADNDNSESQALECAQHPTSVVERNARIIKWLCNVRKAKTYPLKTDAAALADSLKTSTPAEVGENG